jgi:hypothetical protein
LGFGCGGGPSGPPAGQASTTVHGAWSTTKRAAWLIECGPGWRLSRAMTSTSASFAASIRTFSAWPLAATLRTFVYASPRDARR